MIASVGEVTIGEVPLSVTPLSPEPTTDVSKALPRGIQDLVGEAVRDALLGLIGVREAA